MVYHTPAPWVRAFLCASVLGLCASSAVAETLAVRAGGDLQAALNAAKPGDVITLEAGATFSGQFVFPAKTGMVTLTTAGCSVIGRVTPFAAGSLATIASPYPAYAVTLGSNWTLDCLRFVPNVAGAGEVIDVAGSDLVTLKRLLFVVPALQQQKRFIAGNGTSVTLTQSHCAGVWKEGQDSQCFAAWDGAGPYTLTDNYLEAASENVMFGGSDSASADRIPSDILIERNTFTKPLAWKGDGVTQVIKNLLEFKAARRVIVRDNTFDHNWGGEGQSGAAIVFTPRNQDGKASWSVVSDVLFERNTVRDVPMFCNLSGYDDNAVSQQTTNIVIRDNDIESDWIALLIGAEVGRLEVYRNAITVPVNVPLLYVSAEGSIATLTGLRASQFAVQSFVWAENIAPNGYFGSPVTNWASENRGELALKTFARSYTFSLTAPFPVADPVPDPEPVPVPIVLTDPQRVDAAIAELQPLLKTTTGKALTNVKNILTRLQTLKGQVK